MSKRRIHGDDIYVAPYTKRYGKYRYVSGHYRRGHNNGANRTNTSYDSDNSSGKLFIWILMIIIPPIMWIYILPSLIKEKKWFWCLTVLIYTIFYGFIVWH